MLTTVWIEIRMKEANPKAEKTLSVGQTGCFPPRDSSTKT